MTRRRSYASYNDGCAAAHALDIVGERWALLVVRELILGPKRFSDLQRDVIGISATALTQRLRDLESDGVLGQQALPAPARVPVYRLTPWGQQLENVIKALSMWGAQSSALPGEADMSPDAVVLAMRAHARADTTLRAERKVDLNLLDARHDDAGPIAYTVTLGPKGCTVLKESNGSADVQVTTDSRTWRHLLFGHADLPSSVDSSRLALEPDSADTRGLVDALTHACGPVNIATR